MRNLELSLESTTRNEALCLTIATGLHILALIWNPILLKSDFHAVHDFVSVDVVESAGSPLLAEKPARMSLMDTLKDMLLKPKTEEIAHVAPEALNKPAAAPNQPLLKEAPRRPMQMNFTPQ